MRVAVAGAVQVIVALIGLSGVIAAALISNWDKLFPHPTSPAPAASQSRLPTSPVSDEAAVRRLGAANEKAYDSAAEVIEGIGAQIEAASDPSIAGSWHDTEGYTYLIQQDGRQFQYRMLKGNLEVGAGGGRLNGRSLDYSYSGGTGIGRCRAELAQGDRIISGACTDAETGARWAFQVNR